MPESSRILPGGTVPPVAEPIVHFSRSRGTVEVEAKDLDSLFDRSSPTTYPHAGPMVNRTVATFLVDSVRERRRGSKVTVSFALQSAPLRPEEEDWARAQVGRFFSNEAELAGLELRVNRAEALGSVWYSIPLVLVAGLVAGILYAVGDSTPMSTHAADYLVVLIYLVFITIVWLMLWDPLEKLLFDSYFIRQRIRALHRLAAAEISFVYRPPSASEK